MQEWLVAYTLGSVQEWLVVYILGSVQEWLVVYILGSVQEWLVAYTLGDSSCALTLDPPRLLVPSTQTLALAMGIMPRYAPSLNVQTRLEC